MCRRMAFSNVQLSDTNCAAAAGGGAVGVEGVDEDAAGGETGPLICGGDCGANLDSPPPPPPGARQSMMCRCGRAFIPYCVFIGRCSRRTMGITLSLRVMCVMVTCSSKVA